MREVYVISSCRTAVGKFGGSLKDIPAADLGATVIAVHTPSGTQYGTVSDIHGRYNMQGLRPGGGIW